MNFRLALSSIVLLALAANQPCFAKDSHARHGPPTTTTNAGTRGKGTSSAHPPSSKANAPIDAGVAVAPPVLPPHGAAQHQIRIINPGAKTLINAPHPQAGAITTTAPRNAIGQPVAPPKTFAGAQSNVSPALPRSGVAPASAGSVHVNVVSAANRAGVNGATVGRPTIAPSAIGGPARPAYGINGTTVQNRH